MVAHSRERKNLIGRVGAYFKRGRGWREIDADLAESVRSEEPVRVGPGAVVEGDIVAPKVVVAGLVRGAVVAQELMVEEGGQIWGDVGAGALFLAEGATLHGWVTSIDEAGYLLLSRGEAELIDVAPQTDTPEPDEAKLAESGETRAALLRRVRAEAAGALVAQARLEHQFEARVAESAGEHVAEAARLREEALVVKGDLVNLEKRNQVLQETLATRDEQVGALTTELTILEERVTAADEALAALESAHEETLRHRDELARHAKETDLALQSERVRAEVLDGRVQNLETALQVALQRGAEQQDALVRWQELAEIAEASAGALEREMEAARAQLTENRDVIAALKGRRDELAAQYETAAGELEELRGQLVSATPVTEAARAALGVANRRIADLEKSIGEHVATIREQKEKIAWHKRAAETVAAELEALQDRLRERTLIHEQMEKRLVEQREQAEEWKTNVGRMTALLYEAEERMKALRSRQRQQENEAAKAADQAATTVQQRDQQIEAMEGELDYYAREIDQQRRRLAEVQATLIERDVELGRVRSAYDQQSVEIKKLRQLATNRIRRLEEDLATARRQLKDVSLLQRQPRRGE